MAADGSDTGDGSGSDSGSSSSGIMEVDYATEVQPIWEGNCLCHLMGASGMMTAQYLTLNPEVSYEQLVGVPSEQAPDVARVEPGRLEDSYLWRKIEGTHEEVGGSGTKMPPAIALNEADVAVIEAWILGGASP